MVCLSTRSRPELAVGEHDFSDTGHIPGELQKTGLLKLEETEGLFSSPSDQSAHI